MVLVNSLRLSYWACFESPAEINDIWEISLVDQNIIANID